MSENTKRVIESPLSLEDVGIQALTISKLAVYAHRLEVCLEELSSTLEGRDSLIRALIEENRNLRSDIDKATKPKKGR